MQLTPTGEEEEVVVGEGTHVRYIVDRDRFLAKC